MYCIIGGLFQVEEGQDGFSLLDFDSIITGVGDLLRSASFPNIFYDSIRFSSYLPFSLERG